jgi:hypothetical protein
VLKQGRYPGQECPECVPDVLQNVVSRERVGAFAICRGRWENGLFKHQGGAAITAHSVHHADEGRDAECNRM